MAKVEGVCSAPVERPLEKVVLELTPDEAQELRDIFGHGVLWSSSVLVGNIFKALKPFTKLTNPRDLKFTGILRYKN